METKTTHKTLACPHCGKDKPKKHGVTSKGTQRYVCRSCTRTFIENKFPFNSVLTKNLVVKAYKETNKSLREIANEYGVSHQTVKNWVKDSQQDMVGFRDGLLNDFIKKIGLTFNDFEQFIDNKKLSLGDEFKFLINEKMDEILGRFDEICEFKKKEVLGVLDGEFSMTRNLLRDYLERRLELMKDSNQPLEEAFDDNLLRVKLNTERAEHEQKKGKFFEPEYDENAYVKKEDTFEIISEILEEEEALLYNVMKESFGEEPANVLLEKERKERLKFLDRLKTKVLPSEPNDEVQTYQQTNELVDKEQ